MDWWLPGNLTGNWGRWSSHGEMDKLSTYHRLTQVANTAQTGTAQVTHTMLASGTCPHVRWRCKGLMENRSLRRLEKKNKPVHWGALPSSLTDLSADSGGLTGSQYLSPTCDQSLVEHWSKETKDEYRKLGSRIKHKKNKTAEAFLDAPCRGGKLSRFSAGKLLNKHTHTKNQHH